MAIFDSISVSKPRTSATITALIHRHDIALAVAGGVLLATLFIVVFGLPWIRDMAALP